MKTELSSDALNFSDAVLGAISRAGGFELVERAERDPELRIDAGGVLAELGVWDLRPRVDRLELEAAAAVCRAAGRFALPYPVAERLAAVPEHGIAALGIVGRRPILNMADVPLEWAVADLAGRQARVIATGPRLGGKLGAFVCPVELGSWRPAGGIELVITLQAWVLLGMVEAAAEMTYAHVQERHQFGKPLSAFQALQFRLTDVSVATQSLYELAKYTLWSVGMDQPGMLTDAIALRLAAIEAAELVFRTGHQLHGAIGFCNETPISWLSRHSQPLRRLPLSRSATEQALLRACSEQALDSPFVGVTR